MTNNFAAPASNANNFPPASSSPRIELDRVSPSRNECHFPSFHSISDDSCGSPHMGKETNVRSCSVTTIPAGMTGDSATTSCLGWGGGGGGGGWGGGWVGVCFVF